MKHDPRTRFAAHLEYLISKSGHSQAYIAEQLGYRTQNIITMFKKGDTRVPFDKVIPLAELLSADPAELLRDWFEAYMPGTMEVIENHLGSLSSAAEKSWISGLRKTFGRVPPFDERLKETLKAAVKDVSVRSPA